MVISRELAGKVSAAQTQNKRKRQPERNTKFVEAEDIGVSDKNIVLEIDTGAAVSIISEEPFNVTLKTCTGEVIPELGLGLGWSEATVTC